MKCSRCGADLEWNSKFCTNCGLSIDNQVVENMVEPQQPKKNNTALIIILVVIGSLFFLFVGFVLVFGLYARNIYKTIQTTKEKVEQDVNKINSDVYSSYKDGDIIKKVKDPLGHEIIIKKDKNYIVLVDTAYLYEEASKLEENAKILTESQIDSSDATKEQKEAMKKIIDYLSEYIARDQYEIMEELQKDNFSDDIIDFAMENSGVDWEEQARIQATIILAAGGFSKEDLISLMEYRGFPKEVAEKAASLKEMDYYEQAVYDACFYKYTEATYGESFDKEQAKEALKSGGYSEEEIEFAIKVVYDEME